MLALIESLPIFIFQSSSIHSNQEKEVTPEVRDQQVKLSESQSHPKHRSYPKAKVTQNIEVIRKPKSPKHRSYLKAKSPKHRSYPKVKAITTQAQKESTHNHFHMLILLLIFLLFCHMYLSVE